MDTPKGASLVTDLSKRIRSLSVDKETLKNILNLLQERSVSAGDMEVSHFQKLEQTDEQYEANKKILREGFL